MAVDNRWYTQHMEWNDLKWNVQHFNSYGWIRPVVGFWLGKWSTSTWVIKEQPPPHTHTHTHTHTHHIDSQLFDIYDQTRVTHAQKCWALQLGPLRSDPGSVQQQAFWLAVGKVSTVPFKTNTQRMESPSGFFFCRTTPVQVCRKYKVLLPLWVHQYVNHLNAALCETQKSRGKPTCWIWGSADKSMTRLDVESQRNLRNLHLSVTRAETLQIQRGHSKDKHVYEYA